MLFSDSLLVLAVIAVVLAPISAGASDNQYADGGARAVADSGLAPTTAELARATYTGIEDEGPITLRGGKWEGNPLMEGGASAPAVWLSEGFRLTGDVDQDGADEAVAHLTYSSGGTGNFGYLAVMGRKDGEIAQKAMGPIGDRVQIREARVADRSVVLDVLQAGPDDGMCCPSQLAIRTFSMQDGTLVETASEVTGTASFSAFES